MHVLTQENESCIKTYTCNVPAIFAYKGTNMPHLKTCSNIPEFFGIVCKKKIQLYSFLCTDLEM